MIRLFAAHPTAANLLTLLIFGLGILTLPQLRRETLPDFELKSVSIAVVYPGASAEEVEEAVVQPIEEAIGQVSHIKKVRSEARENLARVVVTMQEKGDFDKFLADIRTEVEGIDSFPDEAEDPVIKSLGHNMPVASIAVRGDVPLANLKRYCENLKTRLRQLPEISQVKILGFPERQIRIHISREQLRQYQLTVEEVAQIISRQSLDLPLGSVQTREEEILIRFQDQRKRAGEFRDIVIISGQSGAEVPLGDMATIEDRFKRDEDKVIFENQRAGILQVIKSKEEDSLKIVEAMKKFVDREMEAMPDGISLVITDDRSTRVKHRLLILVKNGWQGLILVFLSMWIFFNIRLAFWVAMGLPVSFLATFYIMLHLGYSINMMTMLALLVALGLIMDDAIVIAENIATNLQEGKSSLEAVVDGVNGVKKGVISSFLTTACIFVPSAFIEGNIGQVLRVIPVVLVIVLIVSIFEAFFILPSHLAHSLKGHSMDKPTGFRKKVEEFIEFLRQNLLGKAVDTAVRWRYLTLGLFFFAILTSFAVLLGGLVKFKAFPDLEASVVEARLQLPQGTPLARTEKVVAKLVASVKKLDKELAQNVNNGTEMVRHIRVTYGRNEDAKEEGPHLATVALDLIGSEKRNILSREFLRNWRDKVGPVADVLHLKFTPVHRRPAGKPIEVLVQGQNLDKMKEVSTRLQNWFANLEGIYDLSDDLRRGKTELQINLKKGATPLGVSGRDIAFQVRAAFYGREVNQIRLDRESYEIEVRLPLSDRDQLTDLEDFQITTQTGEKVPLTVVADLKLHRGYGRIAHVNDIRTVTLAGDVDIHLANVAEVMRKFRRELLPEIKRDYPEVDILLKGETESSSVTVTSMLQSLFIGLIGIFFLLSFQFRSYLEPVIIMTAIPFAFVGVMVGHFVTGIDLNLAGILGFTSLAGIVVNDSILLVEFLRRRQADGAGVLEAACLASRARFRAVFLTSLTTIAGLFPLFLEKSSEAVVMIPIATSIIFGLLASTVLVLIILPSMYAIAHDFGWGEEGGDL